MLKLNKYSSAVKYLKEAIPLVTDALKQTDYPERVKDVYDHIEFNEGGLALEILCENLYEFSCPVPRHAYELLEKPAQRWKWIKNIGRF